MSLMDVAIVLLGILLAVYLKRRDNEQRFPSLVVKQVYIYPIKSCYPLLVDSAEIDARGFVNDRRFMLVTVKEDGSYVNHLISTHPQNALLCPSFVDLDSDSPTLKITHSISGHSFLVPLHPTLSPEYKKVRISMYGSETDGWDLGQAAADFFTVACCPIGKEKGPETRLIWLGEGEKGGKRPVLGTLSQGYDDGIAFNDCASFMVSTTASLDAFSHELGHEMDIIPLRPNILLAHSTSSTKLKAWVEDFWSELIFNGQTSMRLTSNCVRCTSLNIDYATGIKVEGTNAPLRVLSKTRRVDAGTPSPVFGRYGFSNAVGAQIAVGDSVKVKRLNSKRTIWDWPGVS